MGNCILTDMEVDDSWIFKKTIEKETNELWDIKTKVSNGSQKNKIVKFFNVYIKYFLFPLKVFFQRNKYSKILAWQQFYGILLAFYCRLFHVKKYPNIIVLALNYKEKKGFLKKIYYKFMKKTLESKYVYKIIVETSIELNNYCNIFDIEDKCFYCQEGIDNNPRFNPNKGDYFISVGRTNRDYDFLIDFFTKNPEKKLVILSDILNKDTPNNIILYRNVFGLEYEKMLANSFGLILSMGDDQVSSGQLTLMHAMMYKKPIIITKNKCIDDYVVDNYNALVVEKDYSKFLEAIRTFDNDNTYDCFSQNAYKYFIDNCTIESFAKRLSKLIV